MSNFESIVPKFYRHTQLYVARDTPKKKSELQDRRFFLRHSSVGDFQARNPFRRLRTVGYQGQSH